MPDYKSMYCKLFKAQAKVVDALEYAQGVIEEVQQETERLAMDAYEPIALADRPARKKAAKPPATLSPPRPKPKAKQ